MTLCEIDVSGKRISLRYLKAEDASCMMELVNSIAREGGNNLKVQTIDSQAKYISDALKRMQNGQGATIVAECQDCIVANADFAKENGDGTARIGILVSEQYRNNHIGRLMIEELCEIGKSMQIDTMTLLVRKSNKSAFRLYNKLGFQEYQTD